MSPEELKQQIGISLGVLYEGSYGIWTMAQKGVLKKETPDDNLSN